MDSGEHRTAQALLWKVWCQPQLLIVPPFGVRGRRVTASWTGGFAGIPNDKWGSQCVRTHSGGMEPSHPWVSPLCVALLGCWPQSGMARPGLHALEHDCALTQWANEKPSFKTRRCAFTVLINSCSATTHSLEHGERADAWGGSLGRVEAINVMYHTAANQHFNGYRFGKHLVQCSQTKCFLWGLITIFFK